MYGVWRFWYNKRGVARENPANPIPNPIEIDGFGKYIRETDLNFFINVL
jgi:hypothetical protein